MKKKHNGTAAWTMIAKRTAAIVTVLTLTVSSIFVYGRTNVQAVDVLEETCTIDYKTQSEYVDVETTKDGDTVVIHFTILEGAEGDLVLDLSQAVMAASDVMYLPGDTQKFKVTIDNQSGKDYQYKDQSFVLSTADSLEYGTLENGALLPSLGYDGQYMPISCVGAMLPEYFYKDLYGASGSASLNLMQLAGIYDKLEEKGYTGKTPLTDYMLDYLNQQFGEDYDDIMTLYHEYPSKVADQIFDQGSTANGIFTVTEEELNEVIQRYPWVDPYLYVKPKTNGMLEVRIKWPENAMQQISYNYFYEYLFFFGFGETADQLSPNQIDQLTRDHAVASYLTNPATYEETNRFFNQLNEDGGFVNDSTTEFTFAFALNGPEMGNSYQLYSFSWYNVIELQEKSDITLYPITIYMGGDRTDETGENYDGFPHPQFVLDGELVDAADMDITVDGEPWVTPEDEKEPYPFTVNYYDQETGEEISSYYTSPGDYDAVVEMLPEYEDANVVVNGLAIEPGESSELRIRYTTVQDDEGQQHGNIINPITTTLPENVSDQLATAVVSEDSVILTNHDENLPVEDTSGLAVLFDDMYSETINDEGETRYEKLQGIADEMGVYNAADPNRQYMFKYLDLVDTNNGNAWVSSSSGSDIYWPYPEGTDQNTDFDLIHFAGLHREEVFKYEVDVEQSIEDHMDDYEVVNIEKTKQGIYFHVPESGFSPFMLTWTAEEEQTTPVEPDKPNEDQPTTPEKQEESTDLVHTGDQNGLLAYAAIAGSALMFTGLLYVKRRAENRH